MYFSNLNTDTFASIKVRGVGSLYYCSIPCRTSVYNTPVYGIAYGFSKSIIFFLYAIVFRFGAFMVTRPTDDIAYAEFFNVFRVFLAIVYGGLAIGQATAFIPNLTRAKLSANRIFFMLDRKPVIDTYSDEGIEPVSVYTTVMEPL